MFTSNLFWNGKEIENPSDGIEFEKMDEALSVVQHDLEAVVISLGLMTTFSNIFAVIRTEAIATTIIVYKPSFQYEVIDTAKGVREYLDEHLAGVI